MIGNTHDFGNGLTVRSEGGQVCISNGRGQAFYFDKKSREELLLWLQTQPVTKRIEEEVYLEFYANGDVMLADLSGPDTGNRILLTPVVVKNVLDELNKYDPDFYMEIDND